MKLSKSAKNNINAAIFFVGLIAILSLGYEVLGIFFFRGRSPSRSVPATSQRGLTKTTAPTEEPIASSSESNKTITQQNAVRQAKSYLEMQGFSRQGLIDQLSSEYGERFRVQDATVAVDSLNVDWNKQAARSAKSYLEMQGFSCQGLIDQLSSEYGERFRVEQATYGATQAGICP